MRKSEIYQLDILKQIIGEHNILKLYVAVHNTMFIVEIMECRTNLFEHVFDKHWSAHFWVFSN